MLSSFANSDFPALRITCWLVSVRVGRRNRIPWMKRFVSTDSNAAPQSLLARPATQPQVWSEIAASSSCAARAAGQR